MKKATQFIITIILTLVLTNPSFGFAGMATNNSSPQLDTNNTTQSDQNIELLQHLIEVDSAQLGSENKLYVRETLIFKNIGAKNFSGTLRTWVPDGLEGIKIGKIAMVMGGTIEPLAAIQNGNVIGWQDFIESNNPLPPLYALEYIVSIEPKGTVSKTMQFSKKFIYPTLINKQPGSIVLKVTRNPGESVSINDEKGNNIAASGNPREEGNSILYGWQNQGFIEFNIGISKPAVTPASLAGYLVIGILILLVVLYPVIRKKNEKILALEEKIKSAFKREESEEEIEEEIEDESGEETHEIPAESEAGSEEAVAEEDPELSGKTRDELETEKNELESKLKELEKDYSSGNLMDEEYEELKDSCQDRLNRINSRLEKPG